MKNNHTYKSAFSLFELILTILLSSILIIYSLNFSLKLYEKNKNSYDLEIKKTNLLSTKIFLQKHKKDISKLDYFDEKLYFNNALLLDKVKSFTLSKDNSFIKIFINYDDSIKQRWKF